MKIMNIKIGNIITQIQNLLSISNSINIKIKVLKRSLIFKTNQILKSRCTKSRKQVHDKKIEFRKKKDLFTNKLSIKTLEVLRINKNGKITIRK